MTETDVLILIELIQAALPHLNFDDLNQWLAGQELLWLVNHIGAAHKYNCQSIMEHK